MAVGIRFSYVEFQEFIAAIPFINKHHEKVKKRSLFAFKTLRGDPFVLSSYEM